MTTVLNRVHFDHMTGSDRALQREIIALLRTQADGFSEASKADWKTTMHTLKGSARGIGLDVLAALCAVAENEAPSDEVRGRVRAALDEALVELEQFAAAPAFSR